jgi:hypothetical protein
VGAKMKIKYVNHAERERARAAGVFICSGRVRLMDEFLRISQRGIIALIISCCSCSNHIFSADGVYFKMYVHVRASKKELKNDGQKRKCDKA